MVSSIAVVESAAWAGSATKASCAETDAAQSVASNRPILTFFIPFSPSSQGNTVIFFINIEFFWGIVKFFLEIL
jgi:hypothetical protein